MVRIEEILLTCEHGGNRVPTAYEHLFRGQRALLDSHRGSDLGALTLARTMARHSGAPLIAATITRLLVDLNRSIGHRGLLSRFTRHLSTKERERLLLRYYHPHRQSVHEHLRAAVQRHSPVVHLAVHSFVPVWKGKVRRCDIGLLHDPSRALEADFCRRWRVALQARQPCLRIRLNQPYRGWSDGLTTAMRREFGARRYLGIELEVNQALLRLPGRDRTRLQRDLIASFLEACG